MNALHDPRTILLIVLATALVATVVIIALSIRRTRLLTYKLIDAEAHLDAARVKIRWQEPAAQAAEQLRADIARLQADLSEQQANLARQHVELLQSRDHNAQLDAELERYRAIRDMEAALRTVEAQIDGSRAEGSQLVRDIEEARREGTGEITRLEADIARLRKELGWFEREHYYESFGLYAPRFDFETSELYKQRLEEVRDRQRELTKDRGAASCAKEITVDGSRKKGDKLVADFQRLMLRAFNGECDAVIAKVTSENANALVARIHKAYDAVNKLGAINYCSITAAYLHLKLDELSLFHEYRLKKQAERDEQRAIQERIRDEKRALEELERARRQVEQEERRYEEALTEARSELARATEAEQARLQEQIAALEVQLAAAQQQERAISQAELTRAGHVYVISNVGSFGEQVFKIGMTRRLDPLDRVAELGDASVPFPFDVHAIISTQDAPKLENELHRIFGMQRVNAVNLRKEFFSVSLHEIEAAVHRLHGHIEFTKIAAASEYRASLVARKEAATTAPPRAPQEVPVQAHAAALSLD